MQEVPGNTRRREIMNCMPHRSAPHVVESEEVALGESQPLSELLFVVSAVSSAAIDISRSSSGVKHKYRL